MLAMEEKRSQSVPTRTDYTMIRNIVQSPSFQREVLCRYTGAREEVGVYFSGITVIGTHKLKRPNYYQAELLLNTFVSNTATTKLVRVTLEFELPKEWNGLQLSDHFYQTLQTLHANKIPTKVGRVMVYWGAGNFGELVDKSVQEFMVGKLLQAEEKCNMLEDRILYHQEKVDQINAQAKYTRTVNGYQVYIFPITEKRYLGVTCGVAWLGKYGAPVKDMKMVYDLTKMTMAQAKKEVDKACQTKAITDMLKWFISFADMRKRMPTVNDKPNVLTWR
ncbi:hypothetical protein [Bacillus thuringiensis]|uniref:hypothetical protein n=1 Tax=Bacillus thuringiensis TaxID=1428 RepID=UPI000BFCA7F7|nr:hypothetical protein [Bacillus thuringiensis]PGT90119.1 hypothetical protein COD17_10240 [Bacillus thuringiensis]